MRATVGIRAGAWLVIGGCIVGACAAPSMVRIAAGPFRMGCDLDRRCGTTEGASPGHDVTLSAFEIDRTEVTRAAYAGCVAAGACAAPGCDGAPEQPVSCVSWRDAREFCTWRHARLPTEAEWERAARGPGEGRPFPWGNAAPSCARANYLGCTGGPRPVGQTPAGSTPDGIADLAGNVSEWVADWFSGDAYRASASDPQGPATGELRGVRGGAYDDPAGDADNPLHVAARDAAPPDRRLPTRGFRCARSVGVKTP
ncbi:MAG TPA: SUMF1/EgtB/PvdO family nonheme iron enzyme [Kofleriaceae bacterium]|jgi:formylglycine-generating enzyme required for sulfatase activity|nr:SUMF1/EgtB/PvdO family nonheme iron enzyme [Kofleriaceae bacterium]